MSFNEESLKFWVRGHKETGGDEAASNVLLSLPDTPPSCRHRKAQILTVSVCEDIKIFMASSHRLGQPSKAIEESGKIKDVFQDSRPLSSLLEQIDPKRSSTGNGAFNEHIKSSSNSRFDHHKSALGHMEASPRILHGHPATKGRWPWMGEILYKGNHGCGAVLISSTWAITAGHCVRTATAFGSWGLLLRVGELDRQSISGSERDYFVKRIIKHPLFDKDDGSDVENDNDIALLELAYPIADIPGVTPICLPGPGMVDQFAGGDCWGTGWGKTDGNDPSKLQEVKMTVHTTAACSRDYGGRVSGRQLCAGGGNVSACSVSMRVYQLFGGMDPPSQEDTAYRPITNVGISRRLRGDSGSPLSCVKDGWWHVAGVVSWGDDYCRGRPSVYTRISAHLDWIRRTTGLGKVSAPVVGY
ncbi:chymotrypsinogen B-like [Liolophura sinensis]|uniref:chymotrypsinogen B-like n=1 Tax=Liolophura sinensis TaxID=3198878 RepID=UPI0031594E46